MSKPILILTFIILLIGKTPAFSFEVSLSDCLKKTKSKSPEMIQALLIEQHAKAVLRQARATRLPQLLAVGIYDISDDVATQLPDANKAVLRIEQSLYPWASGWSLTEQRALEANVAGFTKIETQADVIFTVKQLYFSMLRDSDAIQKYNEVEEQLKKLHETVIPKYSVGRVPPFDFVKVHTSLLDLSRSRDLLRAQLAGEKEQLARLVGLDDAKNMELRPVSENINHAHSDALFVSQLDSNPSVRVLSETIRASEMGLTTAKYLRFPLLTASVEYGQAGQTPSSMSRGWDFAVGLRLPLFDWGGISAQIEQEKSNVALAESKLQSSKVKFGAEYVQTKSLSDAHLSDYKKLKDLLPQVHRGALVSVTRYRQGASAILEVSDSVNLWLQTLLNERSAFYSYLSDLAKLERLTGQEVIQYED